MTSEDGPGGRVFGVDDQRAGSLEQVGGAVQHGARRLEDGLLGGSALENRNGLDADLAETSCGPTVADGSTSHLAADLSRNAGELWVGRKRGEVLHGLNQRSRGYSTPVSVLL